MLDLFIRRPIAEDAAARTTASGDWLILLTNIPNTLTQKRVRLLAALYDMVEASKVQKWRVGTWEK
jgi:hypothetical protein